MVKRGAIGLVVVLLLALALGATALKANRAPAAEPNVLEWQALVFPTPTDVCAKPATSAFTPTSISLQDLGTYPIRPVGRIANNVPGTPAVSDKLGVGWDRTPTGIAPGSNRGKVILTTHAWPDMSALGNIMTARFEAGQIMMLKNAETHLCYRVTEKLHAPVSYLEDHIDIYDDPQAPPQIAFVTCSGTRLGPGEWDHREIWLAEPVASADPWLEFTPRRG